MPFGAKVTKALSIDRRATLMLEKMVVFHNCVLADLVNTWL
jgi:hypothetical protein